ncbi:DUF5133 domain-containing protein [Streptomyces corynorhini]|uniref:DUF5133 domain-containing protein n=1 Tax=Streptomyces corynorhini TaxID=2282652 RepID=A0A370BAA1_9ACTN|nr:DUF5133 domain-containing protein [Streptomyces corynorhini]RDG37104.1 DUF5133 domain-containing protein [Streptomyces corynorhini]
MVVPRPQILRVLLSRYAEARIRAHEDDTAAGRRALDDVAYTLCVITGTRSVEDALARADRLLAVDQPDRAQRRGGGHCEAVPSLAV